MKKPATPATRVLDQAGAEYTTLSYEYTQSGAVVAAERLGISPHAVIKTLVMQDEEGNPLIVLMHGELEVSLKSLARQLGVKNVQTVSKRDAQRLTGYMVGGISPFGTRRRLPVYAERSIMELPFLYINGGRRGFILGMKPQILQELLKPTLVEAAR